MLLAPPAPSSEREVIIPTPAKWLVKSPGKTELTCVELNLKTVDGMLLLSLGACQLAFAALASVPWEVGSVTLPQPLPGLLPCNSCFLGSQSSSYSFCHLPLERKYNRVSEIFICFTSGLLSFYEENV